MMEAINLNKKVMDQNPLHLVWQRLRGDKPGSLPAPPEDEPRLEGWKRIALHLDRDVRTVRRWEKNQGLPVRRLMHDKQASIYAYRSELDAWVADRVAPSSPAGSPAGYARKPAYRWSLLLVPLLVVALVLGWKVLDKQQAAAIEFGEWDWVLITEFDNRTGEEVLNGTVEYALQRELANSPYVKVAPPGRVNAALQRMRLPPDTPIDLATGQEISIRDGGIRMLVAGRIDRLGNTYVVSTELVNPADGVTLASFNTEASGHDEILPRVSDLASDVRESLGESIASIEKSDETLQNVTTPSLEALQLYSQVDAMMRSAERNKAIPVLEQSLRIDPDFASAHLLLVYLYRDRDDMERAREHLQRAVELAETTSERERLFILATYYRYLGETDREIETYELLTRLYPDHDWANGNLAHLYTWQGRPRDAHPFYIRKAMQNPNNLHNQFRAGESSLIHGEREQAEIYFERLETMAEYPYLRAQLAFVPIHTAWYDNDMETAFRLTEELVNNTPDIQMAQDGMLFAHARSMYMALGKLERLREVASFRPQIGWLEAMADWGDGRPETLANYLQQGHVSYWDAAFLALAGKPDEARAMLADPAIRRSLRPPYHEAEWLSVVNGQIALAEGRFQDTVNLLSDDYILSISDKDAHQFAMHTLAQAHVELGQMDQAISVLQRARALGPMTVIVNGATWFWQRNMNYLRELLEAAGEQRKAREVSEELDEKLMLADAGHPFRSP